MLETVTVRLIFYGLIAFVPNDSSPTSIQALLVDARGHHYASDGCKLPQHVPALYVKAAGCTVREEQAGDDEVETCQPSDDVAAPANRNDVSGSWLLVGQSISLEIVPPDGERRKKLVAKRSDTPPSIRPMTSDAAQDLVWLPAMPLPVDRNCLGAADDCPVAARFQIDDGEVTTCQLSQHPRATVSAFELKPLGMTTAVAGSSPQAMTSAVLVSIPAPRDAKIRIVFRDLADSCRHRLQASRTIELTAGDQPTVSVWVTNLPPAHQEGGAHDTCHDPRIDRHYEMYYNLLAQRVPFAQRSVPHRLEAPQPTTPDDARSGGDKCKALELSTEKYPLDWPACGNVWIPAGDS